MDNCAEISIQTEKHLVIDFLMKYDLNKILKCLASGKNTEREILLMCVVKSKGRPHKLTAQADIDTVSVPHKIMLLQQFFDSFLHRLLSLGARSFCAKNKSNGKYTFMRKRRNVVFGAPPGYRTGGACVDLRLVFDGLGDDKVQIKANCYSRIKGTAFIDECNAKVQWLLAINLAYVRRAGFFTRVNTLDVSKFHALEKSAIFNVYFILSAFLSTASDILPHACLKSLYEYTVAYLDACFTRFDYLHNLDALSFTSAHNYVSPRGLLVIDKRRLGEFCARWSAFVEDTPSAYKKLCGSAEKHRPQVLSLIALFKMFAEVFLVLEGFQHRLAPAGLNN